MSIAASRSSRVSATSSFTLAGARSTTARTSTSGRAWCAVAGSMERATLPVYRGAACCRGPSLGRAGRARAGAVPLRGEASRRAFHRLTADSPSGIAPASCLANPTRPRTSSAALCAPRRGRAGQAARDGPHRRTRCFARPDGSAPCPPARRCWDSSNFGKLDDEMSSRTRCAFARLAVANGSIVIRKTSPGISGSGRSDPLPVTAPEDAVGQDRGIPRRIIGGRRVDVDELRGKSVSSAHDATNSSTRIGPRTARSRSSSALSNEHVASRRQRQAEVAAAEELRRLPLVEGSASKIGCPLVSAPPIVGTGSEGSKS